MIERVDNGSANNNNSASSTSFKVLFFHNLRKIIK